MAATRTIFADLLAGIDAGMLTADDCCPDMLAAAFTAKLVVEVQGTLYLSTHRIARLYAAAN